MHKLVAVVALALGVVMMLIPSLVGLGNEVRPLGVAVIVLAGHLAMGEPERRDTNGS